MFFDEEMLLDLRLNIMDKYIDKFVITEATYTHSGQPKKLIFDINKFSKFKDKITYLVSDNPDDNLLKINAVVNPVRPPPMIQIFCILFIFFNYLRDVIYVLWFGFG